MSFTAPITLPGLTLDPQWYRRSVFYEVMIRSFVDSNGDGSGDLQGLTSKLDYLQWLGVDALWLPPFFTSPLRDGGYDVSDFRTILPEFGTIDEFKDLVTKAHERNMRVIIDLPLNHTSDQHEWFQQSRSDPEGPYGDFYVWNDTDDKWPDIRIIFVDTEDSNWAFDSERRQFYFHRFFSHQPDLNFENPAVHEAMFDIIRYWLDMGVDGFRLDAIPYLYESDEGNGEGEPPTHEFIKRLRSMVDREYPGRVMVAEANQWPREVAAFFGTEDEPECHMAFDFPVMPRIFYSLRSQQAGELVRVLSETTDIPEGAGWGVFLRNHDELTLEMVSEEYRQAMYGWYAYDPRMRANIGIRRRLAPLLDNSRAELELAHALLFSLPGSPFLYYGDEIGMGDNIWLPDRDSFPHSDAVDPRPQCRVLDGRPRQALPPCGAVAGLPLQPDQRRGPARPVAVLASLDPQRHPRAQGASGVRTRVDPGAPDRPRVRARVRSFVCRQRHSLRRPARRCAVRLQLCAQPRGRDPRGPGVRRFETLRSVRRRGVPDGGGRRALQPDSRDAELLLAAHRAHLARLSF